ncbi:ArgE/DapE family deacylase [Staphylococcus cohnii]|uniref:Probable succinyl-diaminopimelate desuccinylase n=2 Tax=Staphylococcus cohnii TaxID=29382 RepID=A0ABT6IZ23_9STAP|nr:ArgE/DapE family deacylase [Staphylococcus cohnii]TGP62479.1 ArgE/DapE family deacylase [bacterium M00.F.Ca.ET.229.01.1.1]TGS39312.1 ArgE/DapE family deacylase [bacterium M00.F.Ca.ET.180.01.1.1]KKI65321.1 Acetylornithine deacetylase [Staphylococcus cohnii subsp. cohnii]MCI2941224.1 ArgE/DapE family deacylase [Staphylococcus cohnii]MDE1710418.1 ArgE/DapE family deacylase [Staphylococcus cohnii]
MSTFSNEEKVQILSDIVAIETVNDNELEVCNYLQQLFSNYGIESKIQKIDERRANLIAEIGEGNPVIGISGHMDVVSAGNKSQWTYDPFSLTEDDGFLYGRGAADMKSGLAALAIALIDIKQSQALQQGRIRFLATSGEEMEQLGSQTLYEHGYMDDVDALLIAEPCQDIMVYAHKGSMDYRITSYGKSAHSSMPVMGINAINPLISFIQDIDDAYARISKEVQGKALDFTKFIDRIKPSLPATTALEDVESALQGLVISNTLIKGGVQVNSVPEEADADFNIRTIPEYDNAQVKALFSNTIKSHNDKGANLSSNLYLDLDPVLTTGDNSLINTAQTIAKSLFDKDFIASPIGGVTDASNLLKNKDENFPFLVFGPGIKPHQIDECVEKDMYLKFIDFYSELLTTYSKNL